MNTPTIAINQDIQCKQLIRLGESVKCNADLIQMYIDRAAMDKLVHSMLGSTYIHIWPDSPRQAWQCVRCKCNHRNTYAFRWSTVQNQTWVEMHVWQWWLRWWNSISDCNSMSYSRRAKRSRTWWSIVRNIKSTWSRRHVASQWIWNEWNGIHLVGSISTIMPIMGAQRCDSPMFMKRYQ